MKEALFPVGAIIEQADIDLETMRFYAKKWGVEREQTEKGLFSTSIFSVHTPNIQLGYADYSHGVMRRGDFPSGAITLGFVVGKESTVFENELLSENELIYVADGETMDILSHTKSSMFVVIVEKELFFNTFYSYFSKNAEEMIKDKKFLIDKEKTAYFVKGLNSWMHYLKSETFQSILIKEYTSIELDILKHLLSCIVFESRPVKRSKFQAKRVRDLLHESLTEKVTIEELIKELDISERQLHDAFKSNYGLTPKQYLKNLRLNAIKKELLAADPNSVNISNIVYKYGFTHMSHFSQHYKMMFKETATETFQKK